MSQAQVIVKYDGPILVDHKMDVEQVAPAMLALSELVKKANKIANGERASVKVLAIADVDEHCFSFGIEIVQTLFEQAKDLLSDEDVATAIRIAEIVGLVAGVGGGLFGILKFLRGRTPDSTSLTMRDGKNVVQIVAGGDVYYATPEAQKLLEDQDAIREAKAVTKPLTEEGYESLDFKSQGGTERIDREEAIAIQTTPLPDAEIETKIPESEIRAWVKIRKAIYDGTGKWTIQYDKSRDVAMNDREWLERFQKNEVAAPPGTLLEVKMKVSEIQLDKRGKPISEPEFSIEKVFNERPPPPKGSDLFDDQGQDKPSESTANGEN